MNQSSSAISALIDIIADPKKALAGADINAGWLWLPLILLITVPALVAVYYFQTVDIDWLADRILTQSAGPGNEIPEGAKDFLSRNTLTISAVVGQAIVVPIILLISALYLHLVNKFSSTDKRGFKNWFSLSVWTAFPGILAAIAALIYYLVLGENQIAFEDLNFFTANSLITHYAASHPAATFMNTLSPFTFWSIGLVTVGLMQWTKRTMTSALMIAAAPYVAIYGVWSFVAFG